MIRKDDMIVCWRHNWKACPKEIMVLELSKAMRMQRRAQNLPRRRGDAEEIG